MAVQPSVGRRSRRFCSVICSQSGASWQTHAVPRSLLNVTLTFRALTKSDPALEWVELSGVI